MAGVRPFALVRTTDQWFRAVHSGTFVDPEEGVVALGWIESGTVERQGPGPELGAGLAFDAACRLYHSVPGEGRVERVRWGAIDPFAPETEAPLPFDLFEGEPPTTLGEFVGAPRSPALEPRGLAADVDDRLFVADSRGRDILVFDLYSRRLVRRLSPVWEGGVRPRPLDLACRGHTVWSILDDPPGLLRLEARRGWVREDLPDLPEGAPADAAPRRVAVSPRGEVVILFADRTGRAWIVRRGAPRDAAIEVDGATDLEFDGEGRLVVARGPGADFVRIREGFEATPLKAGGYDGFGIVRTPDGRIAFWSDQGVRHAVPARVRYAERGRVSTYRLDAGQFHTGWGRLFVDACIPEGTDIRMHVATTDESADEPTVPASPPGNLVDFVLWRPDLTPPLPPTSLAPGEDGVTRRLHRRETGREIPWARPPAGDPFETYEAPVDAEPGRYLWVTLELRGDGRATPRVKSLRVEHPSHDLLRRLPRAYSREAAAASFLRRYLAMFDGALGDLDARATDRQVLLDPHGAPQEVLPWLASFVGLVLDERWPLPAKRELVDESVLLFRFRGTVAALRRFLQIYLGTPVIIVEHFKLRGLGGGLVGGPSTPPTSTSVLGAGFRVGGTVGERGESLIAGSVLDSFQTHAHRFTVVIPAVLSAEQLEVVHHVLELHRPAHTVVDVCTVGAGMRLGRGLHVGLSSIIGRTGRFAEFQVGSSLVGRGAILGRPAQGTRLGDRRLGEDTRLG